MTEVTAAGIRSGDPSALAGLCARRGAAVLVYSEHVAARGEAPHAAADAFARFRAMVAATNDPALDAETLLFSATRHAAAARGLRTLADEILEQDPECPDDTLLVQWIEETLPRAESERIELHVPSCSVCVDAMTRFEAAERAYEHPPSAPLPPTIARMILDALVAAAPVTALNGDAAAVREAAAQLTSAKLAPDAAPARAAPVEIAGSPPSPPRRPAAAARRRASATKLPVFRRAAARLRPSPHSSARERRADAGAAVAASVRSLVTGGRGASPRRPGSSVRRRQTAIGLGLSALVALVAAVALLGGDPSPSADKADSAGSNNPPPPAAVDEAQESVASQRAAERARARAARERAASARSAREARSRRAAARRREAAAARRAAAAPSPADDRAQSTPSRPPAAEAANPPPPPPAPPPSPRPPPPPPSSGGSDEPPGGEFTVAGET